MAVVVRAVWDYYEKHVAGWRQERDYRMHLKSHPPEKNVARTFSTFGWVTGLSAEIGFWTVFFGEFLLIDGEYGTQQKKNLQESVGREEYGIRAQNRTNARFLHHFSSYPSSMVILQAQCR